MEAQSPPPAEETVAFLDIGTNSIRIMLARITDPRKYTILTRQKETVRLGDGAFEERRLRPDAIERAATVCHQFATMARANGATRFVCVATAACREAVNGGQFVRRLRDDSGIDVRIVSGKEEARLIYLGVSSGLHLADRRAVFIDIGGGSTEIIYGNQWSHYFLDSLNLGAIRLSNAYFTADDTGPVSREMYERICQDVSGRATRPIRELRRRPIDFAIGSSGTIESLVDIAARLSTGEPAGKDDIVPYDAIRKAIDHLCSLPLEKRRRVEGLNPNRADIIIAGAAIIDTIMRELKLSGLRASDRGALDGLLIDDLKRHERTHGIDHGSLRERSVLRLAESCQYDESHARHVARLARMLFDSAADLDMHEFDDRERELLFYSAILHDVGAFLSYHNHHEHTYYFVRHAELLGFDQTEINVIAMIARFHQKSMPRRGHPDFDALDKRSQLIVRQLCVLLRIAESLDRSHTGIIRSARLGSGDTGEVTLEVVADADWRLERWAVERHTKAFRKSFRKDLVVRPSESLEEEDAVVATRHV